MRTWCNIIGMIGVAIGCMQPVRAQFIQNPSSTGVVIRPIQTNSGAVPTTVLPGVVRNGSTTMVPLGPIGSTASATTPTLPPATTFDPYSSRPSYQNPLSLVLPSTNPALTGGQVYPQGGTYSPSPYGAGPAGTGSVGSVPYSTPAVPSTGMFGNPVGVAPSTGSVLPSTNPYGTNPLGGSPFGGGINTANPYGASPYGANPYGSTLTPSYPGMGQSGSIGVYNGGQPTVYPPNTVPGTTPLSLFPTSIFGNSGGGLFGSSNPYGYGGNGGYTAPGTNPYAATPYGANPYGTNPYGAWNPQGTFFNNVPAAQPFVRFFQGPRFRHTWIYGNNDNDGLMINDSDFSLAFVIPNFGFSTQPLYILPSFSLHNWDGPAGGKADLPALAYSAFLDTGWQSDPLRIAGVELGVRVGVFSDFETYTTDSLRVTGRALGRVRLTPTATLKGGIVYLDRNKLEFLPAGGILWQPNPATRFDVFFPEPKLAHYLSTIGTYDSWWYVTGNYGGGSWTIKRAGGATDSIDINDIRLCLGLEWGRNDQLRDGRRVGFFEVGYVFNRELIYKHAPGDNLDLQDSLVLRAGLGY